MRRVVIAALSALAVAVALAPATIAPRAVNTACQDGETGITNGCAPFCPPGRFFDYDHTGLCLLVAPPPPPPPNDPAPQSVPM